MVNLSYDFHIHSCLSPCGDNDMTPANIVGMCKILGLDAIALTDHNSCKNCVPLLKYAEHNDILAIPGMELCTSEEVHVVCLFPEIYNALHFDEYVYSKIIPIANDENIFGNQLIYDENDKIIGSEPLLLINATSIDFDDVFDLVREYNGIMIPAHIDKLSNSLISNLGFIPPDSKFSCVEIKKSQASEGLKQAHPYLNNCNIVTNSDAHFLEAINEPVNFLSVEEKSIAGIFKALANEERSF